MESSTQWHRFTWPRFSMLALIILAIPNGIAYLATRQGDDSSILQAMMFAFSMSMLAFFAYRFHVLRTSIAQGRLSRENFSRDPQGHIRGPSTIYYIWLAGTLTMMFAIVAYGWFK